jgi:hypothetical protein
MNLASLLRQSPVDVDVLRRRRLPGFGLVRVLSGWPGPCGIRGVHRLPFAGAMTTFAHAFAFAVRVAAVGMNHGLDSGR